MTAGADVLVVGNLLQTSGFATKLREMSHAANER